jgi:hypothetical protein
MYSPDFGLKSCCRGRSFLHGPALQYGSSHPKEGTFVKSGSLLICFGLALAGTAAAQAPVVSAGGIVNAASYAYAGLPSGGIAPGFVIRGLA